MFMVSQKVLAYILAGLFCIPMKGMEKKELCQDLTFSFWAISEGNFKALLPDDIRTQLKQNFVSKFLTKQDIEIYKNCIASVHMCDLSYIDIFSLNEAQKNGLKVIDGAKRNQMRNPKDLPGSDFFCTSEVDHNNALSVPLNIKKRFLKGFNDFGECDSPDILVNVLVSQAQLQQRAKNIQYYQDRRQILLSGYDNGLLLTKIYGLCFISLVPLICVASGELPTKSEMLASATAGVGFFVFGSVAGMIASVYDIVEQNRNMTPLEQRTFPNECEKKSIFHNSNRD